MENNNINTDTGTGRFTDSELAKLITGFFKAVITNKTVVKTVVFLAKAIASVLSVILFFSFFFYFVPFIRDPGTKPNKPIVSGIKIKNSREYRKQISGLKSEAERLAYKFRSLTPGQSYLIINTTANRFYLYRNRKLLREGFCSSGSYTRLVTPEGSRQWIFKTPKGKFWIQQKIVKPLWVKPDWAFIEEGLPVPPPDDESRYEWGVLGDYAMSLGDGYLIHGTLYKRFLGMPVTHGCIRLNDEDLEAIFNTLNIGSKVFIF